MKNTKEFSNKNETILKAYAAINTINEAARAIILVCKECNVTIEEALPLITATAKKLQKQ